MFNSYPPKNYFILSPWRLGPCRSTLTLPVNCRSAVARIVAPMSIMRHIAVVTVLAAILSGCSADTRLPKIASNYSADSRDAPWPDFLPVEDVLTISDADVAHSVAEIRALKARAWRLRRRAWLLRGPVVDAQERIRLENAANRTSD